MRARRGGVDRTDLRMREGTAHECGMGGARNLDVVGVRAAAGDEACILAALDAGAEHSRRRLSGARHGIVLTGPEAVGTLEVPHAGVWMSVAPAAASFAAAECTARTMLW